MEMIEFWNRILEEVTEQCESELQNFYAASKEPVVAELAMNSRLSSYLEDIAEEMTRIIVDAHRIVDEYLDKAIASLV